MLISLLAEFLNPKLSPVVIILAFCNQKLLKLIVSNISEIGKSSVLTALSFTAKLFIDIIFYIIN
ncbi:MAG: hypothetical protein ACTSRG_14595 [Candidatus Helarchaeota archaeon]